ncbi:MAG TPA: glycoside hydrolase family 2 TIM barrel-domain containing protein [Terracidiphilus sp.]|jgi:beta-glucuronidase|nr:glycoside hydrolase family 2 TIM barrel-domain containing protein [Terracidiphilus sp.]
MVLTGADRRPSISLNGEWSTIVDPYFAGLFNAHGQEKANGWFMNRKAQPGDTFPIEYDFSKAPKLKVPGDWNTQKPELFFYEGLMWYERDFHFQPKANTRLFLRIGAANYKSYFWVNGKKICEHEGGFTAFACEVTAAVRPGDNFVVAAVDNTRHDDGVPSSVTDWWNYGGLTREVSLIEVPEQFIDQYDLHLSRTGEDVVEGWVHVQGARAGDPIQVEIPALQATGSGTVDERGRAAIHFSVHGLESWTPEDPKLYDVDLHAGQDVIHEQMGFRTVEVRGTEILLNGKPIFLRGVCIHAEAPYRTGRAWSEQDAQTLLGWVKELGGNFARLAHYPHDENMLRAADRMGVLIWSENPVYQAVEFDNPAVLAKAEQQLDEEIGASRNHASIILWSMANETPDTPARTQFIETLAGRARQLDPSRLITAALLVRTQGHTKVLDDPLAKALDVIGFNEYVGWYEGVPETADITQWQVEFAKPLIVSEFGAAAKAGLHGSENKRWTEEYQANVYRHQLAMLNRIPQLRGMSAWLLMDFRSPLRPLAGIQDDYNRKGLISEKGEKKLAFSVLRQAYKQGSVGKPD